MENQESVWMSLLLLQQKVFWLMHLLFMKQNQVSGFFYDVYYLGFYRVCMPAAANEVTTQFYSSVIG